jgi:hypothetical protein
LGEFSPIARLFTLSSFGEITKVAPIFELLFPTDNFGREMDWATFWVNFSQSHLVTRDVLLGNRTVSSSNLIASLVDQ